MNTQHKAVVTGIVQLPIEFNKTSQGNVYSNVIIIDDKGQEIPIFFDGQLANELKKLYQPEKEINITVNIDTRRQREKNEGQKKEKYNVVLQATEFELKVTH